MNFWFYCDHDDDTEVCFSVQPDHDFLVDKIGQEYENVHPKVLTAAYGEAYTEFIRCVKALGIQVREELFVTAQDIPVIREAMLKKGWKEKLYEENN